MARRVVATVVSLALALAPSLARADDAADARAEYAAGTAALAKSSFREAAEHFEIAARLRPHAAAFYAAGKAWQLAGDLVKSADRLSAAVERAELTPADKQDALHRLASIEEKVGTVNVGGDAAMELQIDDGPAVHPNGARHGLPGKHTLFIRGASGSTSREVMLNAGGALPIVLKPELVASAAPTPTPMTQTPAPGPAAPFAQGSDQVGSSSGLRVGGIVLLSTGAAAAGVSIGLGSVALSARKTFLSSRTQADFDKAEHLQTATNIGWTAAAVLGGAGATLLVISIVNKPEAATALEVSPRGATIRGRF